MDAREHVARVKDARDKVFEQISKIIVGQEDIIEGLLISLFSRGHCLMIGVPGLAKTLMVNSLARIIDLKFKRVQFTPDLMPSDITGTDIIQEDPGTGRRTFKFIHGPIFTNILLADEINRTPPKTQAALLESMGELTVTSGGETYTLDPPFFVLATQNPIEQEGTYPLPEAQLDRFMFSLYLDYTSFDHEMEMVRRTTSAHSANVERIMAGDEIVKVQGLVREVPVADHVIRYATKLTTATRPKKGADVPDFITRWLSWGAGPRATQYLILGAKARAILHGRFAASCDDVRSVAHSVLRHRLTPNYNAVADGVSSKEIVDKLLEIVEEPAAE